MIEPLIPQDETCRLQSLLSLKILDSHQEERFDRITRLARRVFDVPIALVSLVDRDRQWFKSRAGLEAEETPREISFCGHAITGDAIFLVPNALEDERFRDNPLVIGEPHIRFYAGYPLRDPAGSKLGTLCIIDRVPRELSADDLQLLQELGEMVESELFSLTLATTDELTGISNRRGFQTIAGHALAICRRLDRPATLVMFDLDDFKVINDSLGHDQGDRALTIFATCLLKTFRDSDVVARLGGDEFCVLLTGNEEHQIGRALERLRENLDTRRADARVNFELRFTAGATAFDPKLHSSVEDLLRDADGRMYAHKRDKKTNSSRGRAVA